jgi:hypothetical protein
MIGNVTFAIKRVEMLGVEMPRKTDAIPHALRSYDLER